MKRSLKRYKVYLFLDLEVKATIYATNEKEALKQTIENKLPLAITLTKKHLDKDNSCAIEK